MFSSSSTERQGQVGDLRHRSRAELQDLLLRQDKILSNRRLLQTLPDKGKRIREFAERVRLAIKDRDEEERKQSARTELQSKHLPAASQACQLRGDAAAGIPRDEMETLPVFAHVKENSTLDERQDLSVLRAAAAETMETAAAGASLNSDETKECDLVRGLESVKLSPNASAESKDMLSSMARENYFLGNQKVNKPHYFTVVERTAHTTAPLKQKFRTNQLPHRSDNTLLRSLSPNQFHGASPPLSALARKEQDRKHLNDITAVTLPPLHHNPAQLLPLEESAVLITEQTKRQQELQAKEAAQKLSESLRISMGSYSPDAGPKAAYREVHDEGAEPSSEED
ncbi:protein GRINL1A [Genypterus blacodes]|uniref:protein GRINL1A n=1 Tax=Genypterus blacodes TaxID=154954 RepID=UPI003F75CFE3